MLKKRVLIVGIIAVTIVVAFVLYGFLASFSSFSILSLIKRENTPRTSYARAFSGILSYNPDGASGLDFGGNPKWNVSFEMQDPQLDREENYALIYDRRGTAMELLGENGEACRINTTYPITAASVANNGNVAVVMQQSNIAYINVYDYKGDAVAEGQLRGSESGFPLSISLSSTGTQLVVSTLHLSESDVKSDLIFYDFSGENELQNDNKQAVFSYVNELFPIVDHVAGDKIFAVGTNGAIVFSGGVEPKVTTELFYEKEVKSVIHNKNLFAMVMEKENENNEVDNVLTLYSLSGTKRFEKVIPDSYTLCKILDNDEVLVTDGKAVFLYTPFSIEKFSYIFSGEVTDFIYENSGRTYFVLQNGELSKIRLK